MVCRVSSAEANLDFTSTALAFVSAKTLQEEDGEDGEDGADGWRWREESGGRRVEGGEWREEKRREEKRMEKSGWRRGKQKTENDEIPMNHGTRNKKQETRNRAIE